MIELHPPTFVLDALERLRSGGHSVCLVGGCVRDAVRGVSPHDWDICTSVLPEETIDCFSGYPVIPTGLQHGTVTLLLEGTPLEITTFRVDGEYTDGRRPDRVTFTPSLTEDLSRRDFTINAMAWNPWDGLIDPYGGQQDIKSRLIRCVGEPSKRFGEDALRILRGLRFSSRLGYGIHQNTAAAILRDYPLLEHISGERIAAELLGLLEGVNVEDVLLQFAPVFCYILPCLQPLVGLEQNHPRHLYDGYTHTVKAVAAAPPDKIVRLAALFHDVGKPACQSTDQQGIDHFYGHPAVSKELAHGAMRRLKLDNETVRRVGTLVFYHDVEIPAAPAPVRRWLSRLGEENFRALLALKRADREATRHTLQDFQELDALEWVLDEVIAKAQCFSLKQLGVNGRDLISLGIAPGKRIGEILASLLAQAIEDPSINEKEILLALVREQFPGDCPGKKEENPHGI